MWNGGNKAYTILFKVEMVPSNTYEHPAVLLKYADYLGTIHGFAPK